MRKIYPSLFNKFAVFILYGLLSAAVILVQAQDGCIQSTFNATANKLKTIGYVQLYAGRSPINASSIQWKLYDFINVIAFPNPDAPNGPWNGLISPDLSSDEGKDMDFKLKEFMQFRNTTSPSTKVLLSIRNYDLTKWNLHMDPNPNDIPPNVNNIVRTYGLDGVDIEYPGMRGVLCRDINPGRFIWNKTDNDGVFVNSFLGSLRQLMQQDKIIMLTVGDDVIVNPNNLDNYIDFLNIETYHYSLYQNLRVRSGRNGIVKSYPNDPLNVFDNALKNWNQVSSVQKFMGIDFGNTFQIVNSSNIENSTIVDTGIFNVTLPYQIQSDSVTDQIGGLCPNGDDQVILYSFPSKGRLATLNSNGYCNGNSNSNSAWIRKFDQNSSTPWLYRKDSLNPKNYNYVSYEDLISLGRKIEYAINNSIFGMSISNISYIDDTFLAYIRELNISTSKSNPFPNPGNGAGGANSSGTSTTSTNSSKPKDDSNGGSKPGPGVVVGAVFGSVFGLIIISGIIFLGYRNRDKFSFGQNQYSKNMYDPGTNMNQAGTIKPENSPRMVMPDTAAIPVAPSYVTAMFDFIGKEENDLSFKKGDKIEVLERGDGPNDWWVGRVNGAVGEFPGNYVRE